MRRLDSIFEAFTRRRAPGVCQWLEENITLPKGFTAQPGPVRFSGREFMRFALELFHPESGVSDLTISAGTQLMKTAGMLLGLSYRMVFAPAPSLIVVPSLDFARNFMFGQRLDPLISANKILSDLKPADADGYKQLSLAMKGGFVDLAGSNSPTNLSGRTVGQVYQDECCKFEHRSSGEAPEAHPMLLADERAKAYGSQGWRYKSSSPNITTHPFWRSIESGSQTVLAVPCPECKEWFNFEWASDEEKGYRSIIWDPLAKDKEGRWDLDKVRTSARYVCPACAYPIPSGEKPGMIRQAQEKHLNPSAPKGRRSFIIPSFYSPTVSFGDVAVKWVDREKDLFGTSTRNITNSWFALPYEETEVEVKGDDIRNLKAQEYRKGTLPFEPVSLMIFADPGETSGVHWAVVAGGGEGELAAIDWGVTASIQDLERLRLSGALAYQLAGTRRIFAPAGGFIDSGYDTDTVYQMAAESGGFWTPTRGMEKRYGNWTSNPIRSHPTIRLLVFTDCSIKNEFYDRRIAQRKGPRVMLPADTEEEFVAQLSGQKRDGISGKWKRIQKDHWGDCMKQAVLAQWVQAAVAATIEAADRNAA